MAYCLPRPPVLSASNIFMYLDVSDRGPDQTARRRALSEHLAHPALPNILYMHGDCYLHKYHSAIKDGLQLADQMLDDFFSKDTLAGFSKYFTSVAQVVNAWRLLASEMMAGWARRHESPAADPDTLRQGRRYPLSVIAGRWGSIEKAEDFLLERKKRPVEEVMLEVLSKHMRACAWVAFALSVGAIGLLV